MAKCQAEVDAVNNAKNKLSDSLALAIGSKTSLQQMLKQTQQAIVDNKKHQDEIRQRIHDIEVREAETQRQMDATRKRLALRRAQYAEFMRRTYEHQDSIIAALFGSHGISDFLTQAAGMARVRAAGSDLVQKIRDEETRLKQAADSLRADHDQAARQQQALDDAQHQLLDSEVRESQILTELSQSINDAQHELVDADKQAADLVAKIVATQIQRQDELIQAANDAAWAAAQSWMAAHNAYCTTDCTVSAGHSTKYPFIWPAQKGVITQGFGPTDYTPEPPGFGAAHFHAGVDIANDSGTPIYAADDGVVVAAEDSMLGTHLIGYGRHVIIAHRNGVMTLYGHLQGYVVKPGDQVHQGDMIGIMGSTGNSSGPHLHFEVRINGTPTDPMPYLPPNGPNSFRG